MDMKFICRKWGRNIAIVEARAGIMTDCPQCGSSVREGYYLTS